MSIATFIFSGRDSLPIGSRAGIINSWLIENRRESDVRTLSPPVHDTIVIGAGPAGTQAAFRLASLGHSVLLLDSQQKIGAKVCTGIVSRQCAEQFDIPDSLLWHEGRKVTAIPPSGSPISIERHETQAYVIDRTAFVQSIAERAAANGAELKFGHRVTDAQMARDGVTVVSVQDGETFTHLGRSLIVASGFGTGIAAKVGLDVPRVSAYGAQAEISIDIDVTRIFMRDALPNSYFGWIVPIGRRKAYLGVLGRERPLPVFRRFLTQLNRDGYEFTQATKPGIWGVPLRPSRRSYSERALLVGDAAGQIKPTTGGGIYFGLIGGELAAKTLSRALTTNDFSLSQMSAYEHEWKSQLGKELRVGYIARLFYENMKDSELENFISTASHGGLFEANLSFDRHSEVLGALIKSGLIGSLVKTAPRVASRIGISML